MGESLISKRIDWEEKLFKWVDESVGLPYEWGQWDCVTIIARAVDVLTGTSMATDRWLGRWSSFQEALDESINTTPIQGIIDLGGVRASPEFVQVGDFLMVGNRRHKTIHKGHIYLGDTVITATENDGVYLGYSDHIFMKRAADLTVLRVPQCPA